MRQYMGVGCLAAVLLLAAWLYLNVAEANAGASREFCRCNLEQLALGLLTYAQDNDNRLPDTGSWELVLRPYYTNPTMVICPQDIRLPWYRRNAGLTTDTPLDFVSYDMVPHWSLRKLPLGKQAAAALAFHETGKEGLAYRHFGGMNAAFLDGHVRWYSREALPPDVILTGSAPSPPAP